MADIVILQWLMVVVITLGLTEVVTAIGKQMGGQLRPHFIAVCRPDFTAINCTDEQGFPRYVTDYECAGDPKDVLEARYTTHLMLTTITLLCLHEPQNVLKCIILRTKLY